MSNDLIYDVGVNNGSDTAHYLWKGYRVVGIEANPVLCEMLAKRFANQIAEGRLTLLNIGVAASRGVLPFWICEARSEWSSFNKALASRDGSAYRRIEISCRRFSDILDEHGTPHYLKVDIEGNDDLCLSALAGRLELPKYLSVEASAFELLPRLRDLGYTSFKCISQDLLLPLQEPPDDAQLRLESVSPLKMFMARALRKLGYRELMNQVRPSRVINGWRFPGGSSGPFGEDLPGRWLSFDELATVYQKYSAMQQRGERSIFWRGKAGSFWMDFHARR